MNIKVKGRPVKQVYSFQYLGASLNSDASCKKKYKTRLNIRGQHITEMSKNQ